MSQDHKGALKEIREYIKNKNNIDAVKRCEKLLQSDPTNYMGLVLMGAAYQETDKKEAAKYLKRAIEVSNDSDPTVALQGLANCAEIKDLPNIFDRLLKLVPAKYSDYHEKLVNISNINNFNECCDILKKETEFEKNDTNSARIVSAFLSLGKIFIKTKKGFENYDIKDVIFSLETLLNTNCDSITEIDCFKLYFKQLYKDNDYIKLVIKADEMAIKYPNEANPIEWICQVYSTQYTKLDIKELTGNTIEYYTDKLLSINQNSALALLIKALLYYENKQYVQARDILLQIKDNTNASKELLIKTYLLIGAYGLAENICRQLQIQKVELGISLCYSDDKNVICEGITILETLNENNELTLYSLARAYHQIGNQIKLKEIYAKLELLKNEETLNIFKIDFEMSAQEGIDFIGTLNSDTFQLELRKGKLYLELKEYEKSLLPLLKATKIKPYYADCFLYLGLLYFNTNDFVRARKCFEKCINLNPCCDIALQHLCGIYRKNEELDLNRTFLSHLIEQLQGKQAKWVHFHQGLDYLETKDFGKAVDSLRLAVRYDSKNILFWEALADAYYERGSYNSAMRVFQDIVEQQPQNMYAKLQIANIKMIMHVFTESIECFKEILKENGNYLPALKGIAEAHYQLANHQLQQRLLGRCKNNLQAALDYLQEVFLNYQHTNFIWLWRLTANIFTLVAGFPSNLSFLKVHGILAKNENQKDSYLQCKELYELALKFYTCALKLNQEDTFLWQELSLCAYYFVLTCENCNKKELIQLAKNACKSAIKCVPTRWQTWNLLGVLYATKIADLQPNYSLAQHYFIKALNLEKNSAIPWCNLGVIYLNVDNINLANKAFKRSQDADPGYINAWIGQAMLAEILGEDEEAMDLFRHCTQLDFHLEAALGYSHWVCKILSDENSMKKRSYQYAINNLHAISNASDSISWYFATEDDKASVESLSYYGYLFSKQKLWSSAIKAYKLAVEKAQKHDKDELLFNLAYCYLKSGKPKLAIKKFNSLSESTIKSNMGLALAYSENKDYQQSYEMLRSALEWLSSTDEEKAKILLSMSAIIYSLQGEDDTKSILYQCLALENRPMEALFSTLALGIIHSDFQLAESILEELTKFQNDIKYCHHIAFLTAQYYYVQKQSKRAYFYLLSRVHTYPERPQLRKVLADFLLNYLSKTKKYSNAACQIAQSVIILGHQNENRNDSLEAAKALLTASESMKNINKHKQKKLIQQSIHLHPSYVMAWKALAYIKM